MNAYEFLEVFLHIGNLGRDQLPLADITAGDFNQVTDHRCQTPGKQILVTTDNKAGTLLRITAPVKEAGVGIRAVCAWAEGAKANFLLVLDNTEKGGQAPKKARFNF